MSKSCVYKLYQDAIIVQPFNEPIWIFKVARGILLFYWKFRRNFYIETVQWNIWNSYLNHIPFLNVTQHLGFLIGGKNLNGVTVQKRNRVLDSASKRTKSKTLLITLLQYLLAAFQNCKENIFSKFTKFLLDLFNEHLVRTSLWNNRHNQCYCFHSNTQCYSL